MGKWLELARREFSETSGRLTDNTDDRTPTALTSVTSVGLTGKTEKSESSNVSNVSKSSGEIRENHLPDELNPATMTRTMPDDPALRGKVHRLLDQADELDRAGDEAGALRILDDIRRTIQNASTATVPVKALQNSTARVDEVTAATTSPRPSNEECGDIHEKPDPVLFPGSVPTITPPSDHADVVSERAAILEYDAGMNRATAEREAVREVGPCYLCGGGRFWVSRWGVIVCERCHPAADTRLIERTIVLSDDNGKRAHA